MAANITHGMNVEQVRQLSQQLNQKASNIDQILSEVNSALQNTSWIGPDADSFKSKWQSEGVRQLTAAKQILTDASQAAARNASEQDTTSAAGSGSF
jgi:hypothetical protein